MCERIALVYADAAVGDDDNDDSDDVGGGDLGESWSLFCIPQKAFQN